MVLSLFSPYPFFRYLGPSIPVLIIITSHFITSLKSFHRGLVIGLLAIMILTGSFKEYVYEIFHNYDGPIKGIVTYLNQNGTNNDTVLITYGDMPLKFYTGMKILGGLTGQDLSIAKNAKWVILRRNIICEKDWAVAKFILSNVNMNNYQKIVIHYPDIPFENREDPKYHNFRTVRDADRVVIFKRIDN